MGDLLRYAPVTIVLATESGTQTKTINGKRGKMSHLTKIFISDHKFFKLCIMQMPILLK